ncbi:MAG: hypothetical protein PHO91_04040 [Patescibacteria group bacterium]|nr:hypothetical protein [Patescibacteria group bacterium]
MARLFRKRKKERLFGDKKKSFDRPDSRKTSARDLIDPVLYTGGLDESKYPFLPLENDRKPEEEAENPLNKR